MWLLPRHAKSMCIIYINRHPSLSKPSFLPLSLCPISAQAINNNHLHLLNIYWILVIVLSTSYVLCHNSCKNPKTQVPAYAHCMVTSRSKQVMNLAQSMTCSSDDSQDSKRSDYRNYSFNHYSAIATPPKDQTRDGWTLRWWRRCKRWICLSTY